MSEHDWSDCQLKINDQLVESNSGTYGYKAYFLSNFARTATSKQVELCYQEFLYPDDPGLSARVWLAAAHSPPPKNAICRSIR